MHFPIRIHCSAQSIWGNCPELVLNNSIIIPANCATSSHSIGFVNGRCFICKRWLLCRISFPISWLLNSKICEFALFIWLIIGAWSKLLALLDRCINILGRIMVREFTYIFDSISSSDLKLHIVLYNFSSVSWIYAQPCGYHCGLWVRLFSRSQHSRNFWLLLILAAKYSNDLIQDVLNFQVSTSVTISFQIHNYTCRSLLMRRLDYRLIYEYPHIVDKWIDCFLVFGSGEKKLGFLQHGNIRLNWLLHGYRFSMAMNNFGYRLL